MLSTNETVMGALRAIRDPQSGLDLIAAGLVRDVRSEKETVTIDLDPGRRNSTEVDAIVRAVQSRLSGGPKVHVAVRPVTPLQAQLAEDGVTPQPDGLLGDLGDANFAAGAGYSAEGPEPLPGPGAPPEGVVGLPVFQWEVHPDDPAMEGGETELDMDGWEYRMWWKVHPTELVYACIEAVHAQEEDERPGARRHPIGRNSAVMLVYDPRRRGVVAIHGVARDFRPFVEAFRRACPACRPQSTGEDS